MLWRKSTQLKISATLHSSETDFSTAQPILQLDYNSAYLQFSSQKQLTYIRDISSDGLWHHLVLTWDSNQGSATLYIDGAESDSVSYGLQESVSDLWVEV